MSRNPSALQLRYLRTLADLGVNQNTTIVVPQPMDHFRGLQQIGDRSPATEAPAGPDASPPASEG